MNPWRMTAREIQECWKTASDAEKADLRKQVPDVYLQQILAAKV